MPDILDEIVSLRREDYARLGPSFGVDVPVRRTRAVVPFLAEPGTILEVKRASPSKGDIAPDLDPVTLSKQYAETGTKNISVLTESRFFKGSLADLVAASSACPDIAFLRKDFLLYEDEIEIAYRSGADAVLLIARILDLPLLLAMAARTRSFGMTAFIEVREPSDIGKLAAAAKAGLVLAGVNARDLATFRIDPLVPATLRTSIPCRTVFESGASTPGACRFARQLGFDGILIGEAAAKNPAAAGDFVEAFRSARPDWVGHFWREIGKRTANRPAMGSANNPVVRAANCPGMLAAERSAMRAAVRRPLVKVCGLTSVSDALYVADLGADMLGFVFAQSPRAASASVVREIAATLTVRSRPNASECVGALSSSCNSSPPSARARPLLVGVIVDPESREAKEAFVLALEGVLDAIQYHGDGGRAGFNLVDEAGGSYGIGRFAAVKVGSEEDLERIESFLKAGEPRVLVDARVSGIEGGTGKQIPDQLVRRVAEKSALWLSGGINPSNVRRCIDDYAPELVDASSGLESAPGKKDHALLEIFFREIQR